MQNDLPGSEERAQDLHFADQNQNPIQPVADNGLTRSQKLAAAGLAFFAIAVLIYWGYAFNKGLKQPFAISNNVDSNGMSIDTSISGAEITDQDLKQKDTDGDGLNDYDELNVYKTSPYLEDSDSDNFSDKEEVDSGNDPTCPKGKNCSEIVTDNLLNSGESLQNSSDNASNNSSGTIQSNQTSSSDTGSVLTGQTDVATLRKMLLEKGMDQELLNQVSDDQLMKIYQDSLKSSNN